ncbi:GDP-mannose 4,6-dehydratase, partial [Candidatus Gottesmanbacteria bacterium RIFOXYB1_FULL_47_11]
MAKKAFVTGIAGFVGSHLAELLLSKGFEVYGLVRPRTRRDYIEPIMNKLHLDDADILDSHSLYATISRIKPDYIFHLAAQSYVPTSWISPSVTLEANIVGSANLFEAVKQTGIDPVIQIACSSEEYGLVHPDELPIKETNPLRPLSPYAVSKLAMDYLGYQYFQSYKVRIVRTRGFNHTGPRRGDTFAESTFAKQIALIEKKKQE